MEEMPKGNLLTTARVIVGTMIIGYDYLMFTSMNVVFLLSLLFVWLLKLGRRYSLLRSDTWRKLLERKPDEVGKKESLSETQKAIHANANGINGSNWSRPNWGLTEVGGTSIDGRRQDRADVKIAGDIRGDSAGRERGRDRYSLRKSATRSNETSERGVSAFKPAGHQKAQLTARDVHSELADIPCSNFPRHALHLRQ